MLSQITPLILTYNEEPNIGRALDQLRWANDILVVDSFSDDETLKIISDYQQARVVQRKFDDFAGQCNFGLNEGGIKTDWVLSLDADYILTSGLIDELANLRPDNGLMGLTARFVYCINGKRLRSGVYPPVTVLFRKANANYRKDGHAHRVVVNGRVEMLKSPILHDDRKSLNRWFAAQSRYTELEAEKLRSLAPASLGWKDRIRRWRIVAPPAMLLYCLIVRGGVLDGWAGFYYAFQRALAELMLSLRISEFGFRNADSRISEFGIRNSDLQPKTDDEGTNLVEAQDRFEQIEIRNPKPAIRNS